MPDARSLRFRDRLPAAGEGKHPHNELAVRVADDIGHLYLYDVIDSEGGYWGVSATEFAAALAEIDAPTIHLHINSPGGMVFEGIAIKNLLAQHPARVVAHVDGLAASAASFIAAAADEVVMGENAELMIHDASTIAWGNAAAFRDVAGDLDRVSDNIASIYARRGTRTAAEWRTAMQIETWYGAQEAVDAGLADRVSVPEKDATSNTLDPRRQFAAALNVIRQAEPAEPVAPAAISTPTEEQVRHQTDTAPSGTAESGATRSEVTQPPATLSKENAMPSMSIEEREARITEIDARLQDINNDNRGSELEPTDQQEWDTLSDERTSHINAVAAQRRRDEQLAAAASNPAATETASQVNERATALSRTAAAAPAVIIKPENIYDTVAIRTNARSYDDLVKGYRDHAMRAVDVARFPGVDKEKAQAHVANLLDSVDDKDATLALRVLNTGSPVYDRAFGKAVKAGGVTNGLNPDELKALSLGSDADGGYAVPFQLDPTVILTNSGASNPMRALAKTVQITGKKWEGLTSAGSTATREGETDEAANSDPTFEQPVIDTSRVDVEVEFSVALEASWSEMSSELSGIIADALSREEAAVFITGAGTALTSGGTLPQGILTGLSATTTTYVVVGTTGALSLGDLRSVKTALPHRWRGDTAWLAADTFYDEADAKATQVTIQDIRAVGDGGVLLGKPKYEASGMPDFATAASSNLAIYGNIRQAYTIVDRIGFSLELIPHVLGANRRPNGKRALWGYRFNGGKVIVPSAARLLRMK